MDNTGVTLEKVRDLKDKGVRALCGQGNFSDCDLQIDMFLMTNRYQILDILDDALQAHKEGKI